jgi:hypothetical protein
VGRAAAGRVKKAVVADIVSGKSNRKCGSAWK